MRFFWTLLILLGLIGSQAEKRVGVSLPFGAKCFLQAMPGNDRAFQPAPARRGACATIDIQYSSFGGVPRDVQNAIEYAADIWAGLLASPETIRVNVAWLPLPGSTLGVGLPNGIKNPPGFTRPDIWFPVAMVNARLSMDVKPGEDDMQIYLDADANWYTGLDGNPGPAQQDLVSVALHEFGHGLGFVSLANFNTNTNEGSFGIIDSIDFPPTSFPFPELDSFPGIMDALLVHGSGARLIDEVNPSFPLGILLTSNDLQLDAPTARLAYGGQNPPMYAPSTFAQGTSISHLDNATFGTDTLNGLMSPFSSAGTATHDPGPIVLGALQDMGWSLCTGASLVREDAWQTEPRILYQPDGRPVLVFQTQSPLPATVTVLDLQGKSVWKTSVAPSPSLIQRKVPSDSWAPGLYMCQIQTGGLTTGKKLRVR